MVSLVIELIAHSMLIFGQLLLAGFVVANRSGTEALRIELAPSIAKAQVDASPGVLDGVLWGVKDSASEG